MERAIKPKTVGRVGEATLATRAKLAGLPLGTEILTSDGILPVEHLTPGDRVISRNGGFVKLLAIDVVVISCPTVKITGGSLGHDNPEEDLVLPEDQHVFVADWRARALQGRKAAAIAAKDLIDGHYIVPAGLRDMRLFQLRFDAPQVVYAGCAQLYSGAPVEA